MFICWDTGLTSKLLDGGRTEQGQKERVCATYSMFRVDDCVRSSYCARRPIMLWPQL